ncbi:hypothetical protein MRX96_029992 [Rhipicephalus microplus]
MPRKMAPIPKKNRFLWSERRRANRERALNWLLVRRREDLFGLSRTGVPRSARRIPGRVQRNACALSSGGFERRRGKVTLDLAGFRGGPASPAKDGPRKAMRGDGSGSRASRPRRSRVAFSATRPAPSWSNPGEGHCRGASPSWLASILLATGGRRADFAPWPIDSAVLKSAAGVRRFVRSPQRRSVRYTGASNALRPHLRWGPPVAASRAARLRVVETPLHVLGTTRSI